MGRYNQIPIYHPFVPERAFGGEKRDIEIRETLLTEFLIVPYPTHLISLIINLHSILNRSIKAFQNMKRPSQTFTHESLILLTTVHVSNLSVMSQIKIKRVHKYIYKRFTLKTTITQNHLFFTLGSFSLLTTEEWGMNSETEKLHSLPLLRCDCRCSANCHRRPTTLIPLTKPVSSAQLTDASILQHKINIWTQNYKTITIIIIIGVLEPRIQF